MYGSSPGSTRSGSSRGPALYYGYCGRSGQYRMMDLPEYMSNVQEGMSRWMNDPTAMVQEMLRTYSDPVQERVPRPVRPARDHGCGCGCGEHRCDCHCECCVCDADVLVHARCEEVRRIPITFENDTRRDKPVRLELGRFVSAGGRDLGWPADLSETQFTLLPCGEKLVNLRVTVRCAPSPAPDRPNNDLAGSVDRCEVGYATIRAEGCLVRPVVVAVAVLPDDCDAYRHPCGCGCCH